MLGNVQEYINVDREKYRYNIDIQTNDLLEELISSIPANERTQNIMNNINITIRRFIQLRKISSKFDENNNIIGPNIIDSNYKPIINKLLDNNNIYYWLLLVASNNKKIYLDEDDKTNKEGNYIGYNLINNIEDLKNIQQLFENYKSNYNNNREQESDTKYIKLYENLNEYLTPFSPINEMFVKKMIYEAPINSNSNVVINNVGDLFSINSKLNFHKFSISKYNTGLTMLRDSNLKSSQLKGERINLTSNDLISINSLLTLPEPTIRFSQVNLPGSSLLTKSDLSHKFLNYWEFLKENTRYSNIVINDFDEELDYDYENNNFFDNIKNFELELLEQDELKETNPKEYYKKFLEIIIPKTIILFKLINKYIIGRLSIVDVINYLEPFAIYSDDLTFMQYNEIINFIDEKIRDYKRKYLEFNKAFNNLKSLKFKIHKNTFLNIFGINKNLENKIIDIYGLNNKYNKINYFTNSELLKKIIIEDYGNLFNNSLSLENVNLNYPTEFNKLFDESKYLVNTKLDEALKNNKCKNFLIAKKYYNKKILEGDNNRIIFFDKEFDKTDYNLLETEYKKEVEKLNSDELLLYISQNLQNKKKMNENEANYLAETLVNGVKKVKDGQYAILIEEYPNNPELPDGMIFYLRKDDIWIEDNKISKEDFIDENDLLCIIQKECLFNPNSNTENDNKGNCESLDIANSSILSKTIKQIIGSFDKKYEISKEKLEEKLIKQLNYYETIFSNLMDYKNKIKYKNNNYLYDLGLKLLEKEDSGSKIVSPYLKLMNLILGQSDFLKKQYDIIKFINLYCRLGDENNIITEEIRMEEGETNENPYFYYCKETNTKLLPTFYYILANVFITNPDNYDIELQKIIKEIGVLSSDGSQWVDKHSGFIICNINFEFDEGFEEGFKVKTRDVLEEDASNIVSNLISGISEKEKGKEKLLSPQARIINNIIESISSNAGINLLNQNEFIIKVVTELMNDINVLEKEPAYRLRQEEAAKKGKKIPEYNILYNSTLMYLTLGMYLIAIQISIPSIKTKKTFPGCIRSFSGFPLETDGDESGLLYIACIAHSMKSKIEPWNILGGKNNQNSIKDRIKAFMIKFLLNYPEVELKIKEKINYLISVPIENIPNEHKLNIWGDFLPPLNKFKLNSNILKNITKSFEEELLNNLKYGNKQQDENINVIKSKIKIFSLGIQELIQNIVEDKELLLFSSIKPFMVNACCNELDTFKYSTLNYFINENNEIELYNNIIIGLTSFLNTIDYLTKSKIFLSIIDSKNKVIPVSQEISEENIYRAFISFCSFNNYNPLTEELIVLCKNKPEYFNKNDSLIEKISQLKRDGRIYNKEQFLRLFQIVSRNNILNINLHQIALNKEEKMENLLIKLDEENNNNIASSLRDKVRELIENYRTNNFPLLEEDNKNMTDLKNYLALTIKTMKQEFIEFIRTKGKIKKNEFKKINNFINNLEKWKIDGSIKLISDDGLYNIINYYKMFIKMFIDIFPNMLINNQVKTINVPKYWKLSEKHNNDIKNIFEKYYKPLKPFYNNNILNKMLKLLNKENKYIIEFIENIPSYSSVYIDNKYYNNYFDKKISILLFEYFLLQVLTNYINLTKHEIVLKKMLIEKYDISEDLYSLDFLENEELKYDLPETSEEILKGDLLTLQNNVANLLVGYSNIMIESKNILDISYEEIMDRVFKLKEKEKDSFTDRLQAMTDEERAVDNVLKINKLGLWSKGLEKGLRVYDPENYDQEREMMSKLQEIKNKIYDTTDANANNIDLYLDDAIQEQINANNIEKEEYSMAEMDEDYYDGDPYGYEQENQEDYY